MQFILVPQELMILTLIFSLGGSEILEMKWWDLKATGDLRDHPTEELYLF